MKENFNNNKSLSNISKSQNSSIVSNKENIIKNEKTYEEVELENQKKKFEKKNKIENYNDDDAENINDDDSNIDKNKVKELKFPETGTNDVDENLYELRHQIRYLKKQLKIENRLFEELLNIKSL